MPIKWPEIKEKIENCEMVQKKRNFIVFLRTRGQICLEAKDIQ